eukprot:403339962
MFIEEEMYFCLKCNKGQCRFCLHEEMESFYCRSCLDYFSSNEAATFKNKCSRYFQCPNCFTIMSVMVSPGPNKTSIYYYNCQFLKINYYKGKYFKNPQQVIFEKLLEVYRYNQEEQIKLEKFQTRARRKTVSFFVPGKIKKKSKFFMTDLDAYLEEKQKKFEEDRRLKPFEEIYLNKLEMQQQEQLSARSYGLDDDLGLSMKSPRDQITPKGQQSTTPRGQLLQQLSASKNEKSAAKESKNPLGDEDAKDLPPEEFIDYFGQLDSEVAPPEGDFLSFEDALKEEFDINQDLYPGNLYLLTKRTKRCKTCLKFVIKPNINPISTEQLKVDFQLIYHVPKVTIYRIGKYQEGSLMEVLLMFKNPNMSIAKILLTQLEESEMDLDISEKLSAKIDLPEDLILIDAADSYNEQPQNQSDQQKPNLLADDEKYVYKKLDNSVVLKLPIRFREGFNVDTQEIYFGIKMKTESLRYGQHPFNLTIPLFINLGIAKKQGASSSQSSQSSQPQTSQRSARQQ